MSRRRPRDLPIYESPDELKLKAGVQLTRTYFLVQRHVVATLAGHEMTLPQFDLLATLRFSEGLTQQELAERLLVTKGNVCGVLDRLERAGWVERRPDPNDARANRLYLLPAGRRKIDSVLPDHHSTMLKALQPLSDAEAAMLRTLLLRVAGANQDKN